MIRSRQIKNIYLVLQFWKETAVFLNKKKYNLQCSEYVKCCMFALCVNLPVVTVVYFLTEYYKIYLGKLELKYCFF